MSTLQRIMGALALCWGAGCQPVASPSSAAPPDTDLPALYANAFTSQDPQEPALTAAVEQLLGYERPALPLLECPGLWISGGCGDGQCDTSAETAENCPADCVFHLAGAYNDLPICPHFMEVVEPTSVEQTQAAVRGALEQGKRIRVLGASHSASQLICGDGVALRMTRFADVNATVVRDDVAYVQPGVLMVDLGDFLYAQKLSIGYTHIGFRGITVAGAIGTAAHGSAPIHASSLAERVVSLELVLADGSQRTFEKASTPEGLWRGLESSLGLLGVITKVGVKVEPAFNLDTQLDVISEQQLLAAESPTELLAGCDFGEMNWFPGQRQVLRWCGKGTQEPAQNANNTLLDPGVSPDLAPIAKVGFHSGTCSDDLNALLEEVRFTGLRDEPPLLVTAPDGTQTRSQHAVGPAHRMMSADLISLAGNKYFQMDWEVAVPAQHAGAALRIARQVFDAHAISLPGVGAFLRFAKIERGGFMNYHSAGEQFVEGETAMFFETPTAVPAGYSDEQLRAYLHVYQELAGLFIRFFGARAHWGKNLDGLFDLQRAVGTYAGRIEPMNAAVAELDPYGVFSNDFAARIGITWPKRGEDFSSALAGSPCACDVVAEPLCDYQTRQTYANTCRARCAGRDSAHLLTGSCAQLEWDTCSLLDPRTCVWRKLGAHADRLAEPLVRY